MAPPNHYYAYLRASTKGQQIRGVSYEVQQAAIEAWAGYTGKTIVEWRHEPAASAKEMEHRPVLQQTLTDLSNGLAAGVVTSKLDRMARSTIDTARLIIAARDQRWSFVALDVGLDMSTPHGELIATFLAGLAQWERRVISERTIDALAVKREQGVRLGRPRSVSDDVLYRILNEVKGNSFKVWSRLARVFNSEGLPTATGVGRWFPATVRAMYYSQDAVKLAELAGDTSYPIR